MSPYLVYILSVFFSLNLAMPEENFYSVHKRYYENAYSIKNDTTGIFTALIIDPAGEKVDSLVALAKNYLGFPYIFGGTTERGFDCSGFVYFLFQKMGYPIPRMPADQCILGEDIKFDDIQRGDLIFFKGRNVYSNWIGHVGMAIEPDEKGTKRFIHAETYRTGVRVDSLTQPYYHQRFIRATRIFR